MRVGIISPYSLSLPGGVQAQVLGLGRALRRQGVEARVLGPCDGPPPDPNVTPLGNSVPTAANGSMAAIAPDPSATLRVIRALRDEAFDAVHVHEPLVPGPSLSTVIFCASPMVATFHRAGQSAGYRSTAGASRIAASRLAVRAAVSEEARATAWDIVGGDFEVLWNGIDLEEYRRATPWPRDPGDGHRVVFFVGRHEARKGLGVLLDAAARLGPEVRVWVAGEGPDTERLRRATAADDRIEWLGAVSDAERVARTLAADVCCAPSLSGESFGVVLLEALAAGTPVVASDLDGYRNVARPGVEAHLVPPGDAAALAGALRTALAGGPGVDAMVRAGLARAAALSMDRLAQRYLELYDVARSRPPQPPRSAWRLLRSTALRPPPRAGSRG